MTFAHATWAFRRLDQTSSSYGARVVISGHTRTWSRDDVVTRGYESHDLVTGGYECARNLNLWRAAGLVKVALRTARRLAGDHGNEHFDPRTS